MSIDVDDASAAPGVIGVFTNRDLGLAPLRPSIGLLNQDMTRPVLADGVVRFVGEPVAMILAETAQAAAGAAELVVVDYDPLPVVVDPEEALRNETLLFPELATNNCFSLRFTTDDSLFDDCEVVVRQRIVNQRRAVPARGALGGSRDRPGQPAHFLRADPVGSQCARLARPVSRHHAR